MRILTGGVYLVADDTISLPPDSAREYHDERRPFVIVSGQESNDNPAWPLVLGCPMSSSTTHKTQFCVKLAAGEANCPKKTWIRVPAIQPLEKKALGDHTGPLPDEKLELLRARVLQYMGLADGTSPF